MKVTRLKSYTRVLESVAKDVANFPVESVTAWYDAKARLLGFTLRVEGEYHRYEILLSYLVFGSPADAGKSWWLPENTKNIYASIKSKAGRQRIADALARGVKPQDLNEALA